MSDTKFTPGPWRYTKAAPSGDRGIHAEGTGIFAEAYADIRHAGENNAAEAEANAHLIAAGPDMYAALNGLLNEPTNAPDYLPSRLWDAARAALAKARGEA